MKRPTPAAVVLSSKRIGSYLASWRKLNGITSADLAARAGVGRATISRLENGDPSVSMATVLQVCRVLGILDIVEQSFDPAQTEFGRIRLSEGLPKRVRN